MASHYVHEENRKHKYATRAVTYYIQQIRPTMDANDRVYKSATQMCKDLQISDYKVRAFIKSRKESTYIRSKATNALYLLKRPVKDLAITARLAEEDMDTGAPQTQEFTSFYQLVKRFRVSNSTVAELRASQPIGTECTKTIYDEFKRKYYLTFWK